MFTAEKSLLISQDLALFLHFKIVKIIFFLKYEAYKNNII